MDLKSKVSRDIKLIESFEIPSSIDLCISTLNAGSKLDFEVWKNELDFTLQSSQIKRNLERVTIEQLKVGCVFPRAIWPEFRMGQYRDNGYP